MSASNNNNNNIYTLAGFSCAIMHGSSKLLNFDQFVKNKYMFI